MYKYKTKNWKPSIREGTSMVVVNKYAYLYGGRSGIILNDIS